MSKFILSDLINILRPIVMASMSSPISHLIFLTNLFLFTHVVIYGAQQVAISINWLWLINLGGLVSLGLTVRVKVENGGMT